MLVLLGCHNRINLSIKILMLLHRAGAELRNENRGSSPTNKSACYSYLNAFYMNSFYSYPKQGTSTAEQIDKLNNYSPKCFKNLEQNVWR